MLLKVMLSLVFPKIFRFLKSGLLLDFLIKKQLSFFIKNNFLVFNIYFNEKYFIENIFFRVNTLFNVVVKFNKTFATVTATKLITLVVSITLFYVTYFLFIND